MVEEPVEIISISSDESALDESAPDESAPDQPAGRSVGQAVLGAGWLAAAVLAVLASFAKVYAYSMPPLDGQTDRIHTSVDGWGRVRVSPVLADTGFSSSSFSAGPRYGLLLCVAATTMLLGWLVQLRAANQPRLAPLGSPLSGLGSVFLCGVVACLLVDVWPVVGTPGSLVRLGPCLYLATGSALLGVATWIVQQRGQRGTALAPALAPENGA